MAARVSKLTRRLRVGVVAALGAALVAGCGVTDLPLPGGPDVGSNPMTLKLKFRDVLDLVPQSTVKMDDVSVGKVTKVELDGYTALVTIQVPGDTEVSKNVNASIRQTSLLGEKFVSLNEPETPSATRLSDGDVIGLNQTGRNPEVEEVLGALSLLLNGGGVGQLKIISEELNTAIGGREEEIKSVLDQIHLFMGQLADNKAEIVQAIESLNRLAKQINAHDPAIKAALDDLPAALKSIDSQRADLVKTLKALNKLSDVGIRVIRDSKAATIDSLQALAPVLTKLADAGQALPNSLQAFLTYPFVDAAVGTSPQAARNLHQGDFTNLSVRLDLDLKSPPALPEPSLPGLPGPVCDTLKQINDRAKRAAAAVVDPLPLTKAQKDRLKQAIINRLVDQAEGQCRAPSLNNMIKTASGLVPDLLETLFPSLPSISVPPVGPLPPIGVPSIGVPGVGGLLPRPGTELERDSASPADDGGPAGGRAGVLNGPTGTVATLGYNSTLGALLLQGVESK